MPNDRTPIMGKPGPGGPDGYYIRSEDIVDSAHLHTHGWLVITQASQAWFEDPNAKVEHLEELCKRMRQALQRIVHSANEEYDFAYIVARDVLELEL